MYARKLAWFAVAVVAAGLLVLLGREVAGYVPLFAAWVDRLGTLGSAAFVAGYVLATVALVPGSVLTLAAGAIFGLLHGTVLVFIAATIGASAAFLLARYVARDAVWRRVSRDARFRALDSAIGQQGLKIVFLIRLSPVFPFNVTNYALGITSVRLRDFLIACIGMLPGTLLYVYYGRLAGDVARAVAGVNVERGPAHWVLLAVGLLATLLVTMVVTRAARRALRASVELPPP